MSTQTNYLKIPGIRERVDSLIEAGADVVYDIAAETQSIVGNVAHLDWFKNAIAEELINSTSKWEKAAKKFFGGKA